MPSSRREDALSEVIGFILILAIITILISLYLVYVVPAEGRQNEIGHMNQINYQFSQYKTAIDSLIINEQKDLSIYNTFTLSTQQISSSSGGLFILPLFQPAGSSGAILINQRTDNIEIRGELLQEYAGLGNATPNLSVISGKPSHIYTNFTLRSIYPEKGLNVSWVPPNSGFMVIPLNNPSWKIWINHTPRVDHVSVERVNYETDLTVTVEKNGLVTIQELIIQKNIMNNTRYYVDLVDPTYGLGDVLQESEVLQRIPTSAYIEFEPLATNYGYNSTSLVEANTLGSLEFNSENNYFINQDYYYQMGGIFLKQDDGMVNKITPSITLSRDVDNITYVSIDEIIILGDGIIGGTSPVQVQSFISEIQKPINTPEGFPNAKWIAVTIETDPESSTMWNETFSRIRLGSSKSPYNVPLEWSSVIKATNSSTFYINGEDDTNTTYDIELNLRRIYLLASLQRIGTILQ